MNDTTNAMRSAALVCLLLIIGLTVSSGAARGENPPALKLTHAIELPGVKGRIDHMAVDLKNHRLFVAALGNDSLEIIDFAKPERLQTVMGFRQPQGAVYLPDLGRLVVSSGGNGHCSFLKGFPKLEPADEITGLDDADNVRYDQPAGLVYVGFGSGGLAVIDARKARKIAEISLGAHPESFRLEHNGNRIFVNLPDRGEVAVVDRTARKVTARWKIEGAAANFPMILDEANQRMFVGCRKSPKLLVYDIAAGGATDRAKLVAQVPCVADTDDVFYDAAGKLIYVSGGGGKVSIIKQVDADHYTSAGEVKTAPGARTSLLVPEIRTLFVAAPATAQSKAQILVYEPAAK